jgi:hypothetical protein
MWHRPRWPYSTGSGPIVADKRTGRLTVEDVAASARELFGVEVAEMIANGPLPKHDWRFKVAYGTGADRSGRITFHTGATAEHVAAYLARENIELEECPDE